MTIYAAPALFLANFALGVLVQFGMVATKPLRWLRNALYFCDYASAALAVGGGFRKRCRTAGCSCR